MDLKKLFTNFAILGLLVFSIMSFVVITEIDNSVSNPITNNSILNSTYGDLSSQLSSAGEKSETSSNNFANTTPTQQFGELEVTSILSPTKIVKTIVVGLWNIYVQLPMKILGVSEVVASLISSVLLVLLIIGVWAIWKGAISN